MSTEKADSQLLRENLGSSLGFDCLAYTEIYKTLGNGLEVSVIPNLVRARVAVAALFLVVTQTAFAVKFTQREFKFQVPARAQINLDLKTIVKEVSLLGGTVHYTAHNLPSWLSHDQDAQHLVGSPPMGTNGVHRFGIEVSQGSTSDFSFIEYTVFSPPKWKQPLVELGTQWEGRAFTLDLNDYIENQIGRSLSFSATGLPPWMSLSADGLLSGLPSHSDFGTYTGIMFRVDGPFGTYSTAGAAGQVRPVPILPKWTKNVVTIDDATEDTLYERVLAEFVSNPDGLPLNFALVAGKFPPWINITNQGKLFGVPRRQHLGASSIDVELSASAAGLTQKEVVRFTFQVNRINKAPIWKESTVLLPRALEGNPYLADLSSYVDDPDLALGDGLFLEIVSGPTWATIAPPALLKGTPPVNFLGVQTWKVRVSDAGGLSATATVTTEVVKANKPPTLQAGLKFTLKERKAYQENLGKFTSDAENEIVTYEPMNFPSWARLAPDGKLEMAPQHADLGDHTLSVRLGDGTSKAVGTFVVTVQADPKAPIWLEDPIRVSAISGTPFALSIADKAKELNNGELTFSKVSGPAWLAVDAAGRVGGSPKDADVGEAKFMVSAKNSIGETQATLLVRVSQGNRPPQWTQDPLTLPAAKFDLPFSFDLSAYAQDPDGDFLRYTKVFGPSWMTLSSDGKVSGMPSSGDQGDYAAVFEVSDGKVAMQVGAKGKVGDTNSLPVLKGAMLTFLVKAKGSLSENLAQKKYVDDADGDTLTFTADGFPVWAALTSQGQLTLSPTELNAGNFTLRFTVSDGKGSVNGTMTVRISKDPRPPLWLEDPVQVGASPNQAFTISLTEKVQDFDGLALTFQKVSGPSWLSVAANGVASGTPATANVGVNTFQISASSANGAIEGTLKINVRTNLYLVQFPLDNGGQNPRTEILWAIDNSAATAPYLKSLYSGVQTFYTGLETAGVKAVSGVISTREWDGRFLTDNGGSALLTGAPADVAADFRRRVERAPTGAIQNSPFWALSRLFEVSKTSTTQVSKGFWSDATPMEVFVLTGAGDNYPQLVAGTDKEKYSTDDFLRSFLRFHEQKGQPFTVSVYDMRCPPAYDPANPAARPAYLTLSNATLGTYFYQDETCRDGVKGAVSDFLKAAAFRAQVFSNQRIKLDWPPLGKNLKVRLKRGSLTTLPGNTGASDDAWYYDAKTKEVVLRWHKILTRVQPGDEIQITY